MKDLKKDILIVFYSYSGNTRLIASKIKELLSCDLIELEPIKPYSTDYQTVVDETNVDHYERIDIKNLPDISKYHKLIILTPTWWYKMTPVIYTFITEMNLSNKIVIPVTTNAGWPGTVIADMTKYAQKSGAIVTLPLEIKFDMNGGSILKTSEDIINKWIGKI